MKSVYVKAPYTFEIRELPVPQPQKTQILVKIHACAVCGSDIHAVETDASAFGPFGHEIAGEVVRCGEDAKRLKPGDRVVLESGTFCHVCDDCRNGHPERCSHAASFMDNPASGGFAEMILVDEQAAVPFDGLSYEEASLAEPLGVALDLFETSGIALGDEVAVMGLGPIGLMALRLAKLAGARHVYAIQHTRRSTARIELAKKLGADEIIFTSEEEPEARRFPEGGMDKVLVTAPTGALPQAFALARYGGIISFLGFDSQHPLVTFDAQAFHVKKLQLRASFAKPALYFPRALKLLRDGAIPGKEFITQTFPLADTAARFAFQRDNPAQVIKMVMVNP